VNALVSAGADVKMITTERSPMIHAGVEEVHPRNMDVLGLPSQINMFRMQRQTVRRALEITATWRPDVIYQRLTLGDASGAILSGSASIPLITEYNGSEVWCNQNWGAGVRYATEFLAAEEAMLRASSMTFTISRVLADQLRSRGLPDRRIGWYPNCIDPAVYSPDRFTAAEIREARESLGFDSGDFVVAFVGTFGDWHGADVFARAIALGSEPGGAFAQLPLRFLFIGDGRNREKAQAIVNASAAKSRCRFVGLVPQADTPLLLAASSCFVSPHVPNPDGSSFFGSPTKLFEYMAMQRPIIASRLEQLADVLEHGKSAIMVEPGNPHELAGAIRCLAADAHRGAELATRARQVALDRYTWGAHVAHISECIRRLTSTQSSGTDCR
jgi:glycosyltransferase involved in cell wall biosynthesis